MDRTAKIFVAGHRGLVGSAMVRALRAKGYDNLLLRTHTELELTNYTSVAEFFAKERPDHVFLAAAKVGGILANNTYPADFIYSNLAVQSSVIQAAMENKVKRLLFLGSSCIYPRDCPQPMREEYLLSGPLEPTNSPYAVAKIAGIETCRAYNRQYGTHFLAVMPTNLYGIGDNYDLQNSHVLPALIRKIHQAKVGKSDHVTVWGTGTPRREFLFSEDLAEACVFLMELQDDQFLELLNHAKAPALINIGCGEDLTIREAVELVKQVVEFSGKLKFDISKPDGTPRKLLDVTRLHALGWRHRTPFLEGMRATYADFLTRNIS